MKTTGKIKRREFLAACGVGAATMLVGNMDQLWADPTPTSASRMHLGMNVDGIVDWSTEWAWVDVFKSSRKWSPERTDGSRENINKILKLTPHGDPLLEPGQIASTLMCREINGHYPGGKYICQFEGEGKLRFILDSYRFRQITPNYYEVDVRASDGGMLLSIMESNPANPVRNIRVWMPGFVNAASPFHPLFVERLTPFKAIRFMNWQSINGCTLSQWKDRTTPQSIRQTGPNGAAIEYMVDLCNLLNADPWFCIPHLADEDFVTQFAALVKNRLKPDRKIYVEWSNEVWNTSFEQTRWVDSQARARGVSHPAMVAQMASRAWKIWHEVFGSEKGRIVRVAAGQHYWPLVVERILKELDGEFDAVSCAAYFDISDLDKKRFGEATTAEDILRAAMVNMKTTGLPLLAQHGDLARKWSEQLGRHLPLVAYEGGQGIFPSIKWGAPKDHGPWYNAWAECQTHPMMKDAYQMWLNGFADAGGELLMAFSYASKLSKWGAWGHLHYQDDALEQAPKYAALLEWTRNQSRG